MALYQREKRFTTATRARRLINNIADFVQECDPDTCYRFIQEVRSVLDDVDFADEETLHSMYLDRCFIF